MGWRGFVVGALLLGACSSGAPLALSTPTVTPLDGTSSTPNAPPSTPSGEVHIAYPEEPAAWYPALTGEPAAVDLSALWGLPLYRYDDHGQLRPGLAAGSRTLGSVGDGWAVEVALHPGNWSDGRPVTATDVVATLEALRSTAEGPSLRLLLAADARDEHTVRLTFDRPYARWPHLLAGGTGVLPAHVLETEGLEAYRHGVPVSGGWFRVVTYEPGRRLVLAAHDGPLGPPGLERLEVAFTPDFETALGLLRDDSVQVILGYLALNPVDRSGRVDGVDAAAPTGGTTVAIRWRPSGALGGFEPDRAQRRRAVGDAIDLREQVQGLLGEQGVVATSLVPGNQGPWSDDRTAGLLRSLPTPSLLVPRWQEAPAFTARAIQRDLQAHGADLELIRLEPDDIATSRQGDGVLEVRRDGPWPSVVDVVAPEAPGDLLELAVAADAGPRPDSAAVAAAEAELVEVGHLLPLYRMGVAHAWRPEVGPLRPSAWPGLGWWNAGSWRRSSR